MCSSLLDAEVQLAALAALPAVHQGKLIPLPHAYRLLPKLHNFNRLLHFSYFHVAGPPEPSGWPGRETEAEGRAATHPPRHHRCGQRGVAQCSDGDGNVPNVTQLRDATLKVTQDKEVPLNNKILTLLLNDILNVSSMCCISRPGAMPCSLSAVLFFQSSSQAPLPSSDKCWEMKSKNASEYPWRHSLVIAHIFPCVRQTKATFQLFYRKYSLPRYSLRFLLLVTAVTIPTHLGAASLRPQK